MEIRSVRSFLDYYERIRERTRRVVDVIPRDKYEWTYREGKFTLADLIRHIAATERYMFAEQVCMGPSRYPGHGRDLAAGPDDVRAFFERCHAETVAMLSGLSDDDLQRRCVTPGGAPLPSWKWLRAMIEHEIHHRGQIYLYLSMLDVETPSLYGLTSEQVKERSVE